MQEICIKDIIEQVGKDVETISINNIRISIAEQPTGYGYKKLFECPKCYQRRTKLYKYGNSIYCRSCSPISPYKALQNSTKGGTREIEYRMNKLAKEYKVNFTYPFNYMEQLLTRPKYYRHAKWREVSRKLQILENMRMNTIFFNKTYDNKIINRSLDNWDKIPYTLQDLQKYILEWK